MGTSKLAVYNEVLTLFGERILASLNDQIETRRVIDSVYTLLTGRCLSMGNWKFATRVATLASTGQGLFGKPFQVPIPSDVLYLFLISENSRFDPPMTYEVEDFGGFWNVNVNTVYAAYLSNDTTVGGLNLALWTPLFENFVVATIANFIKGRIPSSPITDLQENEEMSYMMAIDRDSLDIESGMLPFNATSRQDQSYSSPKRANASMPFAKWIQMRSMPAQRGGG